MRFRILTALAGATLAVAQPAAAAPVITASLDGQKPELNIAFLPELNTTYVVNFSKAITGTVVIHAQVYLGRLVPDGIGGFYFDEDNGEYYAEATFHNEAGSKKFTFAPLTPFIKGYTEASIDPGRLEITTNAVTPTLVRLAQVGVGAVPEPAAWMLMIMGFGAVGGVMRRRESLTVRRLCAI